MGLIRPNKFSGDYGMELGIAFSFLIFSIDVEAEQLGKAAGTDLLETKPPALISA